MNIELAGVTFRDDGVPDGDGVYWMVTSFSGWESPELRQSFHPITSKDGEAIGEAAYGSLVVTLEGIVKCPTETLFWQKYNALPVIVGLYTPGTLTVHEVPTPKSVQVVLGDRPRLIIPGGALHFEFQLVLRATDPVKV